MSTTPPKLDTENQSNPVKYITVFVYNNPDGLGDFKHGLDMYSELAKQYEGTDTQIKLIALIDSKKSEIASNLIEEDLKKQVYTSPLSHPELIQNQEYKKNIVLLTDWSPDDKNDESLEKRVFHTIKNSPELSHHLQNTDLYLNVSMKIKHNRYLLNYVKPNCFKLSICEYGPMVKTPEMEKQRLLDAECSLGFRKIDAGVKFDEKIWEQAHRATNDQEKLESLLNLENKNLLTLLQKSNLSNVSDKVTNYFSNNYLTVGYVQNQQACNNFISISIDSSVNKNNIDVFIPHKYLNDQSLIAILREKNISSLIKIKPDGTEEVIPISGDKNGKVCRCIDFQGLNEHDRKILISTSNIIAGSGDNSFSDALSNPNALPIFQLSKWKIAFYESFMDYMKSHSDGSAEYQLLIDYLQTMGITDEDHRLNINAINNLIQNKYDIILKKWKEVADKLHKDLNFNNNLISLTFASKISTLINNGYPIDTIISDPTLDQILQSDNIFAHRALLVAAVPTNNRKLVEYICIRLESLPPLSENLSFTEYAITNGWKDVVDSLIEKDLVLLSALTQVEESHNLLNVPSMVDYFDKHKNVHNGLVFTHNMEAVAYYSSPDTVNTELVTKHPWVTSKLIQSIVYNKTLPSTRKDQTPILTEYMKNFYILIIGGSMLCCRDDNYFQISLENNPGIKEVIPQPTLGLFQNLVNSWKARQIAEESGTYIPSIDDLVNNTNFPLFTNSQNLSEIVSLITKEITQLQTNPSMEKENVNKEISLKLLLSICYFNQYNYDLLKQHISNMEPDNPIAQTIFQIAVEENKMDVINNLLLAKFELSENQQKQLLDNLLLNNQFKNICSLCALKPAFINSLFERANPEQLKLIMLSSLFDGTFDLFKDHLGPKSLSNIYEQFKEPSKFENMLEKCNDEKAISLLKLANLSSSDTLKLLNNPGSYYHNAFEHLTITLIQEKRDEILKYLIKQLNENDKNILYKSINNPKHVDHLQSLISANISPRLRGHAYMNPLDEKNNEQPALRDKELSTHQSQSPLRRR